MLTISVNPVALTIGSLEIRWYGIMIAIAVISLLVVMLREAKRRGITVDIYSIFLSGIVGGVVGGRLAYVIYNWPHFVAHPLDVFGFQGMAQNGMIIGVVAAALIYMGATRMRFSTLLSLGDVLAVGAPLGLAIARIGCTLNGCCSGQPSPFSFFPLAVIYTPRDSMDPQYWNTPLYFTEFYHLLWGLAVFGIVWQLRGKLRPEGSLFFFFLCIFAVGDFGIRFLRPEGPWVWGLQQAQVLDLGILVVFLPWLIFRMRRFHKQALVAELVSELEPEQSR
jgi:phosphatidylglycerol:prolipoprotein diacylglycerol transferase